MVFLMFFLLCEPLVPMVFLMVFQISTIGINGFFNGFFSNPTIAIEWMVLWLTIDIDGFPMVLGKLKQTWNLSKIWHRQIFRLQILHRQFHLISTVLVRKNTQNEWKWRNFHRYRWQKFYTAAGIDGMDKFHLWVKAG